MVPALRRYREMRGESAEDIAARLPRKRGQRPRTAAYVRMVEAGARALTLPKTVDDFARAYRLPRNVFLRLRAGGIKPETAQRHATDRHHVADCCVSGAT